MIKNDRQHKIVKSKLEELYDSLNYIEDNYSGKAQKTVAAGVKKHIVQFTEELKTYEIIQKRDQKAIKKMLVDRSIPDLGEIITIIRLVNNLTQTDLANILGTKQSNISRLESAYYKGYSIKSLKEFEDALNVTFRISVDIPDSVYQNAGIENVKDLTPAVA